MIHAPAPALTVERLPFSPRPLRVLLDLTDEHRTEVNTDYTGSGYARADKVTLLATHGEPRQLRDVLVIAVHTSDAPDRLDLEFTLPAAPAAHAAAAPPHIAVVSLARFLQHWVPRVSRPHDHVLLVMCNPHHLPVPALPERVLTWADGNVDAFWSHDHERVELEATAWHTCDPAPVPDSQRIG